MDNGLTPKNVLLGQKRVRVFDAAELAAMEISGRFPDGKSVFGEKLFEV